MKAQFGVKWALLILIVTIILVISVIRPYQAAMAEAIRTSSFIYASEIAGIINTMQASPDTTKYEYQLPNIDCMVNVTDYVNVTIITGNENNSYAVHYIRSEVEVGSVEPLYTCPNLLKFDRKTNKTLARELVDSNDIGGGLLCSSLGDNYVMCGAKNSEYPGYKLDKIWCCHTEATVDYENKQWIDGTDAGEDLLCNSVYSNYVPCGAINLDLRWDGQSCCRDQLDMLWCCPVNAGVNYDERVFISIFFPLPDLNLLCSSLGENYVMCGAKNAALVNDRLVGIYCCPFGADINYELVEKTDIILVDVKEAE